MIEDRLFEYSYVVKQQGNGVKQVFNLERTFKDDAEALNFLRAKVLGASKKDLATWGMTPYFKKWYFLNTKLQDDVKLFLVNNNDGGEVVYGYDDDIWDAIKYCDEKGYDYAVMAERRYKLIEREDSDRDWLKKIVDVKKDDEFALWTSNVGETKLGVSINKLIAEKGVVQTKVTKNDSGTFRVEYLILDKD